MTTIWLGVLEQGLLWGVMVLGVYITFRVLDFPDLTVDGSFTLGAAVAARIIFAGYDPWLASGLALVCGVLAGLVTGLLNTKLRIAPLLSGILMMIALYSINLRVMGNKSMLSLLRMDTIYTDVAAFGLPRELVVVTLGLAVVTLTTYLLYLFLQTEVGLALRATGDNERMIRSLGVNTDSAKILGLALGNGLVALSGALVAQYQSYSDVGMGIGMIVVGLASVIVGEVVIGNRTLLQTLVAVVIGSMIYRAVIAIVMQMGLPATDLKLFTAALVVLAMSSPIIKEKLSLRPGLKGGAYRVVNRGD
ncbi:ABC-type transporter, integral membrane subunit [Desulfotomaculum nigrificans CO-1-SRB]|uniref:ABC-type transporter, integral membrane subunit n=1 Tax=Desulfotomaculum nigrificans (strain DSM 14880 / VKM B-2319 / CO-1-SRB) TaxID=868595 RepID=F6B8H4_DESCC|nr:ABC transporter permease [Desulfotomaculum nigrificans]AEF93546.1 ABC-type transporter, integral membrane subunit [Desulfotomaculum nigrificans CO-1-SRB]